MIAHALKIAQKADIFDTLHVSTDNADIAAVAAQYGFAPDFARPAALADAHTPMLEVVKYVVMEYERRGQSFDTVILLYATSPLTNPDDLRQACEQFEAGDRKKALMAVTPFPAPLEHAFRLQPNGDLVPDDEKALAKRTQDLSYAYYDAAMFNFYDASYVKNSRQAGNYMMFTGYQVPSYRVTDIDWPEDWDRAEALYRALNPARQNGSAA